MDSEALAKQNASLNEQVKLLVRTEKRLYQTRTNLELQLTRIRALNGFALGATQTSPPSEILGQAIDLLFPLYTVQAAGAVLYSRPDAAPSALARTLENAVAAVALPAGLAEMPVLAGRGRCFLLHADDGDPAAAALAAWVDELAQPVEGDLRHYPAYMRRDVVLLVGGGEPGAAQAVLVFRSATITHFAEVVSEADLPFLEVVCRHVSRSIEMTALYATLEQRVLERTLELRRSNDQLAESLERLQNTQRQLVEASRRAGMSDVATSVLHNVGNVLNSVNVSATLVEERVVAAKSQRLRQVAELVRSHCDDLAAFFTADPRGKLLPDYLEQLAAAVAADRSNVLGELTSLRRNVDHIKAIVALQQNFAKTSPGVAEPLQIAELVEDAARFDEASYERYGVVLECHYESAIPIVSDRHKILQILTNLLSNARHAVAARPVDRRSVIVRASTIDGEHVIEVEDTGCGIAPENLSRIFNLGFTTRADGHGFGLHASACSAAELGGKLTVHSDGVDRGARFRLILPMVDDGHAAHAARPLSRAVGS